MVLPPLTASGGETSYVERKLSGEHFGNGMLAEKAAAEEHWTAALLDGGRDSGYDGGGGGGGGSPQYRRLSSSSSAASRDAAASFRGRAMTKSAGDAKHRSLSLENRSVEAYYKHLDRFRPERSDSWLDLKRQMSARPNAHPVILKPLKLIRPPSKAVRPKWIFGNPWARTGDKEIRDGKLTAIPFLHNGSRSEPDSAGSLETTVLRGAEETRFHPERAGDKRVMRRQQSRSAWNLMNASNRVTPQPPRKAKTKSLLSITRKGLAPANANGGSNRISPFTPLPSMSDRRKASQARGNRECRSNEHSEGEEEGDEPRISKGDDGSAEVMTINHERNGGDASLSDEEEMKFDEARDIIEGVFTDYLGRLNLEEDAKSAKNNNYKTRDSQNAIKARQRQIGRKVKPKVNNGTAPASRQKSGTKRRYEERQQRNRSRSQNKLQTSPVRKMKPKAEEDKASKMPQRIRKQAAATKTKGGVPNSRLYRPTKPKEAVTSTEASESARKVADNDAKDKRGSREAQRRRRNKNSDKTKAVGGAKSVPSGLKDSEKSIKDAPAEQDESEEDMTKDEAAAVIEEAFLEFLSEDNQKEDDKSAARVPKRLFTDFSDKLAEGILQGAFKKLKSAKDDKKLNKIDEDDGDLARFGEAVDELVARISSREMRNRTNEETMAPDADFNRRAKFNFSDLVVDEDDGGSDKSVFVFKSPAHSVPPSVGRGRRRTFREKVEALRLRR